MTRRSVLIVFIFIFLLNNLSAQTPALIWQKCLGGNNGDYGWSVEPTTDGGFIMAGYTEGPDNGDVIGYHGNIVVGDIWVVKTDNTGNIQWQKCIGGPYFETGAWIHQTADGGYILAGTSSSVNCDFQGNHGGADYLLVKLNAQGDKVWQKLYGGSINDYCWSMVVAPDGGYILAGEVESNDGDVTMNHGARDYWVIKVDASGNLVWQKSAGGSGSDEAYGVQATADGGCIVVGYSESSDGDVTGAHGQRDAWVVKLDNTGNIQWQRSLGGTGVDLAWSVALSNDGGYVIGATAGSNDGDVSGNHAAYGPNDLDYWVVKLNSAGTLQWQKCFGGNANEIAYNIQSTQDGGFLVAGTAESGDGDLTCNAGITDGWIIKVSATGILQWQKQLGGNYYDEPHCIRELSDGSYIMLGQTCSKNITGYHVPTNMGSCGDFWLVKLSAPMASPPNPVLKIDPASAMICPGATATIVATTQWAGLNPTFQWTRNGVPVGGNISSFTSSGLGNGDIIKCAITEGGMPCETISGLASDQVTVSIKNSANPAITISADNTIICGCAKVTFKSTVMNAGASPAYMWCVNKIPTGVLTDYFISSTLNPGDNVTCVLTDQASCIPNGAVVSNSIQISMGTNASPSVSIQASPDTACSGSAITFTASPVNGGAVPVYQWQVNGSNVGTSNPVFSSSTLVDGDIVQCTLTPDPSYACAGPGNAVSNPITVKLYNEAMPTVNISSSTAIYCSGVSATFTASTANAGAFPSYQWKVNGLNVGSNAKNYTNSFFTTGDIVSCTITTDPDFACTLSNTASSNSISVTVISQASPTASITPSVNDVCAGAPIHLDAIALNAGTAPSYQWMINNTPVSNSGSALDINTLADGDQVFCTVTPDSGACSLTPVSTNIFIAVIEPLPVISIQPKDTLINIGQQVHLRADITGLLDSYQWLPADQLEDPFTMTPTTVHLTDNTSFQLTAISNKGCKASATVLVEVGRLLLMPNAFSPNFDGKNDVFRIPPGVSMQLDEFSVFDRWGQRVFTTHNISEGWNGTINGMPVDAGVFVYIIRGSNEKGAVLAKGTVVLVR